MPRYIDADALMATIRAHDYLLRAVPLNSTDYGMFTVGIQQAINEAPTVSPDEVRGVGEWKTAMLDHESFGVRPKVLYCSECHQCIAYPTKFCPSCGARMKGAEDEHD